MRPKSKKVRRLKPPLLNVAKTMGKWRAEDDFLLIQSVLQLSNMNEVHKLTKFSNDFTVKELEERWYAILYDAPISKMIYKNLKKLHTDDILRLKKLAPFSQAEDAVILNLESTINPTNEFFEELLLKNKIHFHEARTVSDIKKQFIMFKKLNLLKDSVNKLESNETQENNNKKESNLLKMRLADIEETLDDSKIMQTIEIDEEIEKEMFESYTSLQKQIKRSEADLYLWQSLVDKVTKQSNPFMEEDTYAILFSDNFEFRVKSREIIIGRKNQEFEVDLDLSGIQLDNKISRNQATVVMVSTGVFLILNNGKLPIYVDGKIVTSRCKTQLYDKSLIEIGDVSMLFLLNYNLIPPICDDSNKILSL